MSVVPPNTGPLFAPPHTREGADPDATAPGAPDAAEVDPRLGATIDGRYRVDRLVGKGGFGRVYEGLHLGLGAISTLAEPAATTFETLLKRESKRRVLAFDPNVRPNLIKDRDAARARMETWVALCDIVKVSRADLDWLYPGRSVEDSAAAWRALGPKLVVMTLGADGAMALLDGGKVAVPGRKIGVVDTVGAGDSFHSALLAGLHDHGLLTRDRLAQLDVGVLKILLDRAVAASAITCSRAGANPPTKRELEDSLGPA